MKTCASKLPKSAPDGVALVTLLYPDMIGLLALPSPQVRVLRLT